MLFRNRYVFLSNMYESPIMVDGVPYTCVEAAFQAQKCANPVDRMQFVGLRGTDAKRLGKTVKLRDDWEFVKLDIMRYLIHLKFQDPILAGWLVNITEPIVENNTWNDTYWGVCRGKGENHLGKILQEERENILRNLR